MKQDERWMAKYNEVVEFINVNHRNPSRHRIEEHDIMAKGHEEKDECRGFEA